MALTFTLFTLIKLINDHFSEPPDSEDSEAERSERRQYNRSVFTSTAYQLGAAPIHIIITVNSGGIT